MGIGQSKPVNKFGKDLQDVDILDIIATKYILTQNFQDMKKLGSKEYCDKLVILTSKIIKKYMNEKEIKYLTQRIKDGNYYNEMTKEKVIYLDTNELSSKSNKRFSKKELDEFKKYNEGDDKSSDRRKLRDDIGDYERQEIYRDQRDNRYRDNRSRDNRYRDNRYRDNRSRDNRYRRSTNDYRENRQSGGGMVDYFNKSYSNFNTSSSKRNKKTVLSELDVRNKLEKDRMCKGIAKFYISIAHLYAAIVKTINPVYIFNGPNGEQKAYSIMNRDKIPPGSTPSLKKINLCSKRINAIKPIEVEGILGINISKVCSLNQKKQKITMENEWRPSKWSTDENDRVRVLTRSLGQEPGIPELEKLYWDKYDYVKGEYIGMNKGGKAINEYAADLKEFYTIFTGKKDFATWNVSGDKKFSDIPLTAFHNSKLCEGEYAPWKQTYKGQRGLFSDYANHLKKMISRAQTNQDELMDILKEIFVIQNADNVEKTEIVTLNPNLTEELLSSIITKTRGIIVKLYIGCEKEFKSALDIFEGILGDRIIKNAVNKKTYIENIQDRLLTRQPDKRLSENIERV
jgi:hypothetical protein